MKKRVNKPIKSFLQKKQEKITNFFAISFLLLIIIVMIYVINTGEFKSIGKASGALGCEEQWLCGEWSQCSTDGMQRRICTDEGFCGTEIDKPGEMRKCTYIASTMPKTPEEQLNQAIFEEPKKPKKKSSWPYLAVSISVVVVLASLGIYNGYSYITAKSEMQKGRISETTIHHLYMYALKQLKEGYEKPEIIQALRAERWPEEAINKVFQPGMAA